MLLARCAKLHDMMMKDGFLVADDFSADPSDPESSLT
jgi:hypothetical protein